MSIVSVYVKPTVNPNDVELHLISDIPHPTEPDSVLSISLTIPASMAAVYIRDNFPDADVEYYVDLPNMGLED